MTTSLEARIERLEDAEAIRNLKMHYAKLCDEGYDENALADLFADGDVSWESNVFGTYQGREAIRAWFENVDEEIVWALHLMTNASVEVAADGETATGIFYLLELATMTSVSGGDPDAVLMTGKYADQFVKVDGRWRFKRISVNFEQASNLDQGWVRQQFREREA